LLVSLLITARAVVADPLPDEIRDAIQQVRAGDGVRPRPPHYLLEQVVPKVAGDPEQRRELAKLLAEAVVAPDTTPAARTVLCQLFSKIGGDVESALLRKLLDNPTTAADARIALGEYEVRQIPPEAEAVYLAQAVSPKAAARVAGLSALAAYYPKAAATACLNALRDPDLAVGATAIQRLGVLDGAALARELPELEPLRQALALDVVADNRIAAARDMAVRLVRTEDENVRAAAVRALGAVGDAGSVAFLADLGAADALVQLHADGVDAAIRRGIVGGDPKVRVALMNAAVARGIPELTPIFLSAATDAEPTVRTTALKLLGRGGEVSAYPRLVALLGGPDSEVVEDAVRRRGRMGRGQEGGGGHRHGGTRRGGACRGGVAGSCGGARAEKGRGRSGGKHGAQDACGPRARSAGGAMDTLCGAGVPRLRPAESGVGQGGCHASRGVWEAVDF
jgi:HEAT repeat protein